MIIKIKCTKPPAASIDDVAEYVVDAISSMGGSRHPEDPMFHSIREIEYVEIFGRRFIPENKS